MAWMKEYFFSSLVVLVLLISTLTACGPTQSATEADDEEDSKVQLRFSWWGGEDRHKATLKAIEKYMELNPNVEIIGEYSGFDGYSQKLSTQIAGGTAPDIMQMDYYNMAEYESRGSNFINLNEYDDLIDLEAFDENFIKDFSIVNEKLVGLPTGINSIILFADQNILDKHDINFEGKYSWEKLIEEGKKVHQQNPNQYFLNMSPEVMSQFIAYYIQQETGKNFIDEDYSLSLDEDLVVEAFTFMKRLWDEGVAPNVSDYATLKDNLEQTPKWLSGDLGAILMSASAIDRFKNSNNDLVPMLPPIKENAVDTGIRTQPSQVLSVNKNSKNDEEAVKFINWFLTDEEAIKILGSSRGAQPTEAGRNLLAEEGQLDPLIAEGIKIGIENSGTPMNAISGNTEVGKIYTDIVEKIGYGRLTPEQGAEQLIMQLNEFLDNIE